MHIKGQKAVSLIRMNLLCEVKSHEAVFCVAVCGCTVEVVSCIQLRFPSAERSKRTSRIGGRLFRNDSRYNDYTKCRFVVVLTQL